MPKTTPQNDKRFDERLFGDAALKTPPRRAGAAIRSNLRQRRDFAGATARERLQQEPEAKAPSLPTVFFAGLKGPRFHLNDARCSLRGVIHGGEAGALVDDGFHAFEDVNVGHRIALHRDEVALFADSDCTEIVEAEQLRTVFCR